MADPTSKSIDPQTSVNKNPDRASIGPFYRGDAAQAAKVQLGELGASGTKLLAGIVYEETNPRLQGQRAFSTWTAMRFDPSGSALHKVYDLPQRAARWYVEPASDDPKHITQADFVHDQLWDFGSQSFDDIARLANLSLIYGFVPLEIVYMVIQDGTWAGKIGWDKFAWRNPATKWRWVVDEVNGRRQLLGMVQKPPPTYEDIFIPADKTLLFVNELEGENYDGWSMFRPCFKPWFYRDALYRIQAVGLERGFMGIPWARLPQGFSAELRDLAKKIVETLRTDEQSGFVHPEDLEVGILSNKLEGPPMQHAIDHHTRMFWVAGLAQMLDLGSKEAGSFALSSDQSELLQMAINAPANRFAEVINLNPGIPQLIRFNFPDYDSTLVPKLVHGDIGQRNIDRLGRVLNALGQWGFLTPDDDTEDKLRQMLDLPERNQDFENRDLWELIQRVQPEMEDWRLRTTQLPRYGNSKLVQEGPGGTMQPTQPGGTPTRGTATSGPSSRQPVGSGAPAEMSEIWPAYQLWRQNQRFPRPRGRVTEEQRRAVKATESFAEFMSEMDAKARTKPERPSDRMRRLRRAYEIRTGYNPEAVEEMAEEDEQGVSVAEARRRVKAIKASIADGTNGTNERFSGHTHVTAQTVVIDSHTARLRERLRAATNGHS